MIFIYVAAAAGLAAFVGACLGARFVYKRMEHRRAVDSEHIRHRKDAARLKERLAERLAGKLEDAFEAARQERSETEKHRIESRLLADHEVEDIAWIFESDNLRDYYNGTVLVDTGWFDRNEIVAAVKGDPDERV
jgi:flagellar biosynthesis/type III secretory pathway M-ring protein FliF/YscJ